MPEYDPTSPGEATRLPAGIGRVPQQPMTDAHSIKSQAYKEVIVFRPIFGDIRNRGVSNADQINGECRMDQSLHGVTYNLEVRQTSATDIDGEFDGVLHEENGMLLYNTIPASGGGEGYSVVKLFSVPHGLTVTAIGNHSEVYNGTDAGCQMLSQQQALDLKVTPDPAVCNEPDNSYSTKYDNWGNFENGTSQGGQYPYSRMTPFLTNRTEDLSQVKDFIHFRFEANEVAQTPFIAQQASVKNVVHNMWIANVVSANGKEEKVLQYSQECDLAFMQRLNCLDCKGVTKMSEDGCIQGCTNFENYILNATLNGNNVSDVLGPGEETDFVPGRNFNEIGGFLHMQCMSCTANNSENAGKGADGSFPSCAEQPVLLWPHMQVNTLRKVSDDYRSPADFETLQGEPISTMAATAPASSQQPSNTQASGISSVHPTMTLTMSYLLFGLFFN